MRAPDKLSREIVRYFSLGLTYNERSSQEERRDVGDFPCTIFRKLSDTGRVPQWPAHDGMGTNNSPTPAEVKANLAAAVDGDSNIKDLNMVLSAVTDLERIQITPEDLLSTRLGLLVNNIRKKATDKVLAKRLKNLVRSWKEACTTPPQGNPPLPPPPTVKPAGESSVGVARIHSPAPTPLVNSQHAQNSGEPNLHAALLSSAPLVNSKTHILVPQLQPFLRPSTLEVEANVSPAQLPAVVLSTDEASLDTMQSRTLPSPPSSPYRPVLHSLTICIPLNRLPSSLVDRLKHTNEVRKGNHSAVEDPLVPLARAVELPPNTVVLPPHMVVFPLRSLTPQPRPLAPSPLTVSPSPPTINLMVNIPLGKVSVRGAGCEPANGSSSRGFQRVSMGGAVLNHTPSVLPKQLELPCSSACKESSDAVVRQVVNGVHVEERSVVCWRYAWAGGEGQYSGIHGYFDHTGQWHDWTMPLPSHQDSVGVLPYVYID